MYVIFETGGKQYKAAAGDVVRVEKLGDEVGSKVKFDKVLAVNDGKETSFGTPYLDAATVEATVTAVGKGEKVIVFKFKAKKDYRRKQGHRQPYTEIEIESVTVGGKTVLKAEPKPAPKKQEKTEDVDVATEEVAADDTSEKEDVISAPEPESTAEESATEEKPAADNSKLTKADIMARLDELGAEYHKSAKKDELLAALAEAEK